MEIIVLFDLTNMMSMDDCVVINAKTLKIYSG